MEIERQQERMQIKCSTRFSICKKKKNSEQDNGHSLDLDQKRNGTLSVKIVHKVNGTKMAEKMMMTLAESGHPSPPSHESIVQRSALEQRRRKIVDPLLCRPGDD